MQMLVPGCHEIIHDNANHVKFIDFAGSGIDGGAPLSATSGVASGLALKSASAQIYLLLVRCFVELETGRVPYNELERTLEMGKLVTVVEGLFPQQKFPPVETLAFGSSVEILHVAVGDFRQEC
ncbi:uncharacterized protein N7515_002597 [Penicillium bovifimosum]|uniref:Uncharacterized protein n=1 Tax=Penicillium bovifimosum TaxID=126998 RepID=A0A9W9HBU0_9EURO|nr:uncharacterized protein N7515_002597 [Penicillium bovifimosum]KAJ5143810.1 hypothetical protein N7515_002597 [Penicillium bovifimosum]